MNTSNAGRVTVGIASYNHRPFLEQAVRSVWRQTYPDVELVVVDDGSSDGSAELLVSLKAQSPIPMRVEVQANQGPSVTFGRCFALGTGPIFALLASDDYYADEFLAEQVALLGQNVVVHSNAYLVEHDGKLTGTLDAISSETPLEGEGFDLYVSGGGRVMPATMVMYRELLERAGGFDPDLFAEDTDLFLRLARVATFAYNRNPVFFSRHTPGSLGKRPWEWGDGVLRALAKHEDRVGDRLPVLLAKASRNVAAACFENGNVHYGLQWSRRAMSYARGPSPKARMTFDLAVAAARGTARHGLRKLVGRERLVALKRRLGR